VVFFLKSLQLKKHVGKPLQCVRSGMRSGVREGRYSSMRSTAVESRLRS
jgi:hypothetical protein